MRFYNGFYLSVLAGILSASNASIGYAQSTPTHIEVPRVSPVPSVAPSASPYTTADETRESSSEEAKEGGSGLQGFKNIINGRACAVLTFLSEAALRNPEIARQLCIDRAESQYADCYRDSKGDPLRRHPGSNSPRKYRLCLAKLNTTLEGCDLVTEFSTNVIDACDTDNFTVFSNHKKTPEEEFLNNDPYGLDEPMREN